jgi:hypothetical protein
MKITSAAGQGRLIATVLMRKARFPNKLLSGAADSHLHLFILSGVIGSHLHLFILSSGAADSHLHLFILSGVICSHLHLFMALLQHHCRHSDDALA